MQHFMIDGVKGYRSRFDHIQLIQEILEEIPFKLGLTPAMPPFLLPYYNGVVPEDCGVSAFVLLRGGHFTLHTFSFREAYFADLVSSTPFDAKNLRLQLDAALPCERTTVNAVTRDPGALQTVPPDTEADFGPHVFLDLADYDGPQSMDDLFDLFDRLPREIDMTPIMRPYMVKGTTADGRRFRSVVTMIAESHIILHLFPDERRAYFDLFSCKFFELEPVLARIKAELPGRVLNEALVGRGSKYHLLRTEREQQVDVTQHWLEAVNDGLARPVAG